MHPKTPICALLAGLIALAAPSCSGPREVEETIPETRGSRVRTAPPIESDWSPATGRGTVRLNMEDGGRAEIHLHQGFEGYTGGLVLGSMDGPAYRYWPPGAEGDEGAVALWCAQDESLVVDGAELTYGWSENLGRGADGTPLRYLGGELLEQTPGHLLLTSTHAGGPLAVTRWMQIRADGTVLSRVDVTNLRESPLTFDLWSGEDPWVGTYGSARGDVGWIPGELVRNERSVPPESAPCLGIVDPDERAAGRPAANAFCVSPQAPVPDLVLFANGFAHDAAEVDPARPLTGDTLTAFNVGWTGVSIDPAQSWTTTYALGPAGPAADASVDAPPASPEIPEAAWRRMANQKPPELPVALRDPLRFASERVEFEVLPGGTEVEIRGTYRFMNEGDEPLRRSIYFPFAIDDDHPYPHEISVSTGRPRRIKDGVVFDLQLDAGAREAVEIRYRQAASGNTATYVVTSARGWFEPLEEAELLVHAPADWAAPTISFPMTRGDDDSGRQVWSATIPDFVPDREFTVSWEPYLPR